MSDFKRHLRLSQIPLDVVARLRTVIVDADDTLWHDGKYFRSLRCSFSDGIVRSGGNSIAATAELEARLQSFGPGEVAYLTAIEETFNNFCNAALVDRQDFERAIETFRNHPVEVLDGARSTLVRMKGLTTILLTKGVAREQKRKLDESGLARMFSEVIIVERKNADTLAAVLREQAVRSSEVLAIGNSIKHDIVPAVANGASAIWLNHVDNEFGRNALLPVGVQEVCTWHEIKEVLMLR